MVISLDSGERIESSTECSEISGYDYSPFVEDDNASFEGEFSISSDGYDQSVFE